MSENISGETWHEKNERHAKEFQKMDKFKQQDAMDSAKRESDLLYTLQDVQQKLKNLSIFTVIVLIALLTVVVYFWYQNDQRTKAENFMYCKFMVYENAFTQLALNQHMTQQEALDFVSNQNKKINCDDAFKGIQPTFQN